MILQPNLFLIGLPKCGTSTIFDQLCNHSLVVGTNPKETFILLDEDSKLQRLQKADQWEYFLQEQSPQIEYLLEGSTHTVFQKKGPEYFENNPLIKGIIVLRDPVKRIYSSFNFTKYNLNSISSSVSFSAYVDDILRGNKLQYVEDDISKFVLSNELKYSQYDQVLKPWELLIKEGRVKIIVFEELLNSPELTYKNIFEWLSIRPEEIWKTNAKNVTLQPKNKWLHQVALSLNKKVYNVKIFQPIKKIYKSVMTNKRQVSKDDLAAMNKLREVLNDSIENLYNQFKVNTSYWR